MFSGKTEELVRRLKRAILAKKKVKVYKPAVDTRNKADSIVSHDKSELPCRSISSASQILRDIHDFEVVGIDEAQFLGPDLPEVCESLAADGIRIVVAGLDMDFKGKPFGPMPRLMAIADSVDKVHAVCVNCGGVGQFSHRKSDDDALILIGEGDRYEPLCRSCYTKVMAAEVKI